MKSRFAVLDFDVPTQRPLRERWKAAAWRAAIDRANVCAAPGAPCECPNCAEFRSWRAGQIGFPYAHPHFSFDEHH
jgi:hypothetical protein